MNYKGDINKILDIEITQLDDNIFKISHPFLIDRIISFLKTETYNYGIDMNTKSTTVGKPLLIKELLGDRAKKIGTTEHQLVYKLIFEAKVA